jgi:rare lipoprotein A
MAAENSVLAERQNPQPKRCRRLRRTTEVSEDASVFHTSFALALCAMVIQTVPAEANSFGNRWGAPIEYYGGSAPVQPNTASPSQIATAPQNLHAREVNWQEIARQQNRMAAQPEVSNYQRMPGRGPEAFDPQAAARSAGVGVAPRALSGLNANGLSPIAHKIGHYKIGSPYQVGGIWYIPGVDESYDELGTASWYGEDFHGKPTANGEVFDMFALTAAHPTLPLPSLVEVTNTQTGQSMIVRVNDRGPFKDDRLIDLSAAASVVLGIHQSGTGEVRVRYIGPADIHSPAERLYPAVDNEPGSQPVQRMTRVAQAAPVMAKPVSFASSEPAPFGQRRQIAPQPLSYNIGDGRITEATPMDYDAMHDQNGLLKHAVALQRPRIAPSGIFVQAASFRTEEEAMNAVRRLGEGGPIFIQPAFVKGANTFRVMVGPWPDEAQAHGVRETIAAHGYRDAVIKIER